MRGAAIIASAGMDPNEDTRSCECCAEPGALPFGRVVLCAGCDRAECDPLEQDCRRVDPDEAKNARDAHGERLAVGDRVRALGGLALGVVYDFLDKDTARVRWAGCEQPEATDLLERMGSACLDGEAIRVRVVAIIAGWHAAKGRNPTSARIRTILEGLARDEAFTYDDAIAQEIAEKCA